MLPFEADRSLICKESLCKVSEICREIRKRGKMEKEGTAHLIHVTAFGGFVSYRTPKLRHAYIRRVSFVSSLSLSADFFVTCHSYLYV